MNNKLNNKNLNNFQTEVLNWNSIQNEMRTKLGSDIYESWLKKIILLKNLIIIFSYQFQRGLLEIGLFQDI